MSAASKLTELPTEGQAKGTLHAVIETPRGSRTKYKYDEGLGLFRVDKVLPLGSAFPFDFGFIPSTRGEDGDPLDVLVLMDEPAFPGCLVPVVLLGVLEAEQTDKVKTIRNDRLLAALVTKYNPPAARSLDDLGEQKLAEVENFFVSYNKMEGRTFKPLGRRGPAQAQRLVKKGATAFAEDDGD
jgi:inorganic pyrophosphatase